MFNIFQFCVSTAGNKLITNRIH